MESDSAVNVKSKLPLNWFGSVGYPDGADGTADEDFILYDSAGNAVASLNGDAQSRKAWADFISRACGSHGALVKACKAYVDLYQHCDIDPRPEYKAAYELASEALAQAKGGS